MKKYIVVKKNSLFTSVDAEFDSLEDATAYRDIMARNVDMLSCGKPAWEYYVYCRLG